MLAKQCRLYEKGNNKLRKKIWGKFLNFPDAINKKLNAKTNFIADFKELTEYLLELGNLYQILFNSNYQNIYAIKYIYGTLPRIGTICHVVKFHCCKIHKI